VDYLGKVLQLEEKLKEYRHLANEIPSSAQALTIKKLQKKLLTAGSRMKDYKKQVESDKKAMLDTFELELFKSREETE
jgi:replicative DNA helicase